MGEKGNSGPTGGQLASGGRDRSPREEPRGVSRIPREDTPPKSKGVGDVLKDVFDPFHLFH
jgi:hypothetical protein